MKKLLLFITFLISFSLQAQVVYEPLHRDVNDFLSRLSQKGVIEFEDQIKPVSRKYIAEKLFKLTKLKENLTNLEKEELKYFIKDFGMEISAFAKGEWSGITLIEKKVNSSYPLWFKDKFNRYRLFSYSDSLFKINFSPILGQSFGSRDGETTTHRWNGLRFYGYISDWLGFSFDVRDNRESGNNEIDYYEFSQERGIDGVKRKDGSIEYSRINTTISADWSWGNITVGKGPITWGYAESGKLVLSQKAPTYPYVRFDAQPVDWLRFNYIHGWLSSNVVDSNDTYNVQNIDWERIIYRKKYIASHTVTIEPYHNLEVSIGESIVYSDRAEISYLMPLMFFKFADHYLSNNINTSGDNGQIFMGISSKNHLSNTHLYGTLFIDEISLSNIFDSEEHRNQLGFTLGGSVVDIPINNLKITAEYTRINPFVYKHGIRAQNYRNDKYLLGHWMGHNSDLIYGSLKYRILRGLQTEVWAQYVRKGGDGTAKQQYDRTDPEPPFLFGKQTNHTYLGFDVKYEIIHELTAEAKFLYRNISEEQEDGTFKDRNFNEFSVALYYGL